MDCPVLDLSDLVLTAEQQSSPDVSDEFRQAIAHLMKVAGANRLTLSQAIAEKLPSLSSGFGAGNLALWLGAQVEHGSDPSISADAIRTTWLRWSQMIKVDAAVEALGPSCAFYAIDECSRSLVSHCAANDQIVERLKCDDVFRSEVLRLRSDSIGAAWIDDLLHQASGELIVLNMKRKEGALVQYRNLSNCFHLFTLLQGVLHHWIPTGMRPSQLILECASGKSTESVNDRALWHYQQPVGLKSDLSHSVWGEGSPRDIQSVNGQQVLLLWPVILQHRGWDEGFYSPQLHSRPPSVELVRELDPSEFQSWLNVVRDDSPDEPSPLESNVKLHVKKRWWEFWLE